MRLENSLVIALAGGDGGRIIIDPQVVLLNGTTLDGNAGGRPVFVTIVSDVFVMTPDSQILTNAPVDQPETDVVSSLVPLSESLFTVESLLADKCATRLPDQVSSFIIGTPGGVPLAPEWLQPVFLSPTTANDPE